MYLLAAFALCRPADVHAAVTELRADLDATLIEDPDGALANGSGPSFFVGRTNQRVGSRRRGLVYFDVAAHLPPGASVVSAELRLVLDAANAPVLDIGLHRVFTPWSEGPSVAGGGGGAAASAGDATWLHTFYDTEFWTTPGGDFAPAASASRDVDFVGSYTWASTPALVADVQSWLDDPASNHGWLLLSDESVEWSAKRFASREHPQQDLRPLLVVHYEVACEDAGLPPGALGLCRAYCEALECNGPDPRGSARACERLAHNFTRRSNGAALPCEADAD
jgi:hypothetical protein